MHNLGLDLQIVQFFQREEMMSANPIDTNVNYNSQKVTYYAVADLHSKILDVRPPWGSKFFQFHAVFGKIWQNRMLAPPLESWRPLLGEILDPPLLWALVAKQTE